MPKDKQHDIDLATTTVLDVGTGFTQRQQWYGNLINGLTPGDALFIRGGIGYVPPEIVQICKTMEARYGVPWWLIAGVVDWETRGQYNDTTNGIGAAGLGQFLPATWAEYAQDGNGDGIKDVHSPWDNLATVAYFLKTYCGYRPGMTDDQLLPVLEKYEGVPGTADDLWQARQCLDYVRQVEAEGNMPFDQNGYFPAEGITWQEEYQYLISHPDCRYGAPRAGHIHAGIDVPATAGTPLVAVENGVIVDEHADTGGGGGNMITLLTGDGIAFTYMHLSSYAVPKGTAVKGGQVIGYAGATGDATGACLHFEVHPGAGMDPSRWYGYYTAEDPVAFFSGGAGLPYGQ